MKQTFFLFTVVLSFFSCSTNNNGTVTVVPIAPTNLTGSVISTSQINLSWTDNATNEDGYKIERKTAGGNYSVVGSTASNMTTFSDLGLTANTSYTYRVYAYNSAGNSLQYSNELTLTTQDTIPAWLTNGLVGYWPFNGNANDESGNGNNGTVNGATLTSDRFGNNNKAYNFNNSLITIPHQNYFGFTFNGEFTVSLWAFKTGSELVTHFIGKRTNPGFGFNWQIAMNMNTNEGLSFVGASGSSLYGSLSGQPCPVNQWINLVGTFNNGTWNLYQNGSSISTNTTTPSIFYTDVNTPITIGNSGGFEPFTGTLDDIRIYNRALSASEIAYLAAH